MLAAHSRDVGKVKRVRQLSRSFINPAEHVGEHHFGRGGWRDSGLRGGATGCRSGGEVGGDVPQADSSGSTSIIISKSARERSNTLDLLLVGGPLLGLDKGVSVGLGLGCIPLGLDLGAADVALLMGYVGQA